MKKTLSILFILTCFIGTLNKAYACSCDSRKLNASLEQSIHETDIIFIGEMVEQDYSEFTKKNLNIEPYQYDLKFKVHDIIKNKDNYIQGNVAYVATSDSSLGCGYRFQKNFEYVVYGRLLKNKDGTQRLRTSFCQKTQPTVKSRVKMIENNLQELRDHKHIDDLIILAKTVNLTENVPQQNDKSVLEVQVIRTLLNKTGQPNIQNGDNVSLTLPGCVSSYKEGKTYLIKATWKARKYSKGEPAFMVKGGRCSYIISSETAEEQKSFVKKIQKRIQKIPSELKKTNKWPIHGFSINNIILKDLSLAGMDFSNAELSNSTIKDVIMNNANFKDTRLESITFENVEGSNVNFENTHLFGSFINSNFENSNFTNGNISHPTFKNTSLKGSNFTNAYISFGGQSRNVDLSYANFTNAQLSIGSDDIDFSGATFDNASLMLHHYGHPRRKIDDLPDLLDLSNITFNGTGFSPGRIGETNFSNSIFNDVKFGSNWKNVNFKNAVFKNTSFSSSRKKGRVSFTNIDFTGADLSGADLSNVTYDQSVKWPEGYDPKLFGAIEALSQ